MASFLSQNKIDLLHWLPRYKCAAVMDDFAKEGYVPKSEVLSGIWVRFESSASEHSKGKGNCFLKWLLSLAPGTSQLDRWDCSSKHCTYFCPRQAGRLLFCLAFAVSKWRFSWIILSRVKKKKELTARWKARICTQFLSWLRSSVVRACD